MKYLLIAALLLAFGAFGKLIGSGVGPAEDERREVAGQAQAGARRGPRHSGQYARCV